MKNAGSLAAVRAANRAHIKQVIYRCAPVTRTEVAARLGLTLPTVTTAVADLLAQGVLAEAPLPDWAAGPQGGRRPAALDFVPDAAFALGAELGPYATTAVAVDVRGRVAASSTAPAAAGSYEQMLTALAGQLSGLAAGLSGRSVLGAGVGLPGFVDTGAGVVRASSHAGWAGRPLAADLAARLGMPVSIDNNARMRVTAEQLFTTAPRPDVFAYYFVSRGIACPVQVQGGVWGGTTAGAGEIGHTIVQPGGPKCPRCGHHGCLDAVAGEGAILARCTRALAENRAPGLAARCIGRAPVIEDVLAAQADGDGDVNEILAQAIRWQGVSLANIANLLSPGLVLVDSRLMAWPPNRRLLRQVTDHYLYGLNSGEIPLEFLPADPLRGARGAAARLVQSRWLEA